MTIKALKQSLQGATAQEIIKTALDTFADRLVIASSLGPEDQVITHMALQIAKKKYQKCRIFILETGRLHQETLDVMTKTQEKYTMTYEIITPNKEAVNNLIKNKGEFSFYESIENRKECCYIRKVAPLKQILTTADAWITGQRKEQSVTRSDLANIEWDADNKKTKFNPLVAWSDDNVWSYIKEHQIPYNPLHDKGYPSIGCEPCTRAIKPDEDPRAGRWWWESADQKECGLHLKS